MRSLKENGGFSFIPLWLVPINPSSWMDTKFLPPPVFCQAPKNSKVIKLPDFFWRAVHTIFQTFVSEIVSCAGGQYLDKMPGKPDENTFIISCDADKGVVAKVKSGVMIADKEVLLTGLLRHKLDLEAHKLK